MSAVSDDAWLPALAERTGPIYLRIVDAITEARLEGVLRPGDRLLPQREFARRLGIDLTTVTRAFSEARRRHLIDAATGRGTFVTATESDEPILDLGMIIPPAPMGLNLPALIRSGIDAILKRSSAEALLSYHPGSGSPAERAAAALWLERTAGRLPLDRIAVGAGAQACLTAIVLATTAEGDATLCDSLTYPGFISLVRATRRNVVGVEADEHGMRPDRLEELARTHTGKLLYLNPTLHNPTTLIMPDHRRREIVEVARRAGLLIIEDDPYSRLLSQPPSPFVSLLPEATFHVATLSKCLSPFLRTAFVLAPDAAGTERIAQLLRNITLMAPPLMTGLATEWIRNGTAGEISAAVRAEINARQELAVSILPQGVRNHPAALHVWLPLELGQSAERIMEKARARALAVSPGRDFAVKEGAPDGLRIALGAIPSRSKLIEALNGLVGTLQRPVDSAAAFI